MSGGPLIETVTLRQTYIFDEWDRLDFYGGLKIFHVLGLDYQSDKFRDAPGMYYPIGGIRALLNIGVSVAVRSLELSGVYFELGMNDLWIANALANQQEVNSPDHITLGLGFKNKF